MQTVTLIIAKLSSLLTVNLLSTLYKFICKRSLTRVSVTIPALCANDLKNNITSSSVVVCDLDKETDIEIDDDDRHKKTTTGNTLNVSRTVYNKASSLVQDLEDIFLNTSRETDTILYISSDYRLLIYVGIVNIEYFLPSDAYHAELIKQDNWDEVKYNITRQDLIDRKKDKLNIYTSAADLQIKVLALFPSLNIKI